MTLTFTLERHQDVVDRINQLAKQQAIHTLLAAAQVGPLTFGIDVSHWQGPIDFAKVKAAGFTFVVMKATQGTGYTDPNFRTYRAQARAAGLIVLMYHFVGTGSATAEANYFISVVGPLQAGEGTAEDYEPATPPADPAGWSRTWLDRVATLGASPWLYMNKTAESKINWTATGVPARYGLWLADYDNDPDMDPVTHWPSLAAEQYWDKATVPGISGPVDVDVFYGTREQLLAYCKGGTAPAPAPTPQEDDMTPEQDAVLRDVQAKLDGYGYRIERIDQGEHGGKADPWGYGTRIEQTQADVAAIKTAVTQLLQQSDPKQVAAALAPLLTAALPNNGTVSQDELEAALRNVLGSLDNK